ncbi:MAG: glycine betaine ABC transporter substrate-binding protein [Pseudonocardiaceae bacterium]
MLTTRQRLITTVAAAVLTATLTACAGSGGASAPEAGAGSLAGDVDLTGVTINVGSKDYPEQRLIAQIQIAALRAAGATVNDLSGLGGTQVARTALETGQIDLYTEYTGTAWQNIFRQDLPPNDPDELYGRIQELDAGNGITWTGRAPLNNTFALAGIADVMDAHNIRTISDYARLASTAPEDATLCASAEFSTRDDGLPGIENTYAFALPAADIVDQESAISVVTMRDQQQCNFTKADATDPRVDENGLRFLIDDRHFFPVYNPAITMKTGFYQDHSAQFDSVFGAIGDALTQDEILRLNKAVQVGGAPAESVAVQFLRDNNII